MAMELEALGTTGPSPGSNNFETIPLSSTSQSSGSIFEAEQNVDGLSFRAQEPRDMVRRALSTKSKVGVSLGVARKRLVLLVVVLGQIFVDASVAVMTTVYPLAVRRLYPDSGEHHNVVSGMAFTVANVIAFLFTPLAAREVALVGPKRLLLLGLLLDGGSTVLFSFLGEMHSWESFLIYTFLLRGCVGASTAMVYVAAFGTLAGVFPQSVGRMAAALELSQGVGCSIGPLLGGLLYHHLDFQAPFLLIGCCILAITLVTAIAVPSFEESSKEENGFPATKVLRDPRTVLILVAVVLASSAVTFYDPTLAPHLNKFFGLTADQIGLAFLSGPVTYLVISPVLGYLADYGVMDPVTPIGLVVAALGCSLSACSTFYDIHPRLWLTLLGYSLVYAGMALAFVPSAPSILKTMRLRGYEDSVALHGTIAGLTGTAMSLGQCIGPSIGSIRSDSFTFGDANVLLACFLLTHFFTTLTFTFCRKFVCIQR